MAVSTKTKIIAFTITIDGVDRSVRNLGDLQKALKDIIKERDKLSNNGGLDLTNPTDVKRFDDINSSIAKMKSQLFDVNSGITEQRKQTSLLNRDVQNVANSYNGLRAQTTYLTQLAKQLAVNLPNEEWLKLRDAIADVVPEAKAFTRTQLDNGEALDIVKKKIADNNVQLRDFDRAISGNNTLVGEYTKGIADFFKQFGGTDILKNKLAELTAEEVRLKKAAESLISTLAKTQQGTQAYADLEQQVKETAKELEKATTEVNNINNALGKSSKKSDIFRGIFQGIGQALAEFGLTSVTDTIRKVISMNVQMDQTLARVAKTTQLTKEQARQLNRELRNIDTGTAEEELRNMAIVAGKLGIEGVANIRDFVKATDRIKVALGSELGQDTEATLERLAKIVNIFGLGQDYPFANAVERVGSAVNYLSDAGAASASGLVDFTRRLAGVAPIANISVTDILGFGSALEELGQTSEVSGTAMVRLILKLGQDIPTYSKLAGKSIQEFSDLLKNDANEALLQVIAGAKSSKEGVEGLARTLGVMEINGVRVATVFGALANNLELVRKRQDQASEAFEKNIYLEKAFALQTDTLGTSFGKLAKNIGAFVLSEGFTDTLKGWVTWINNVTAARNKFTSTRYRIDKVLSDVTGGANDGVFDKQNFVDQITNLQYTVAVLDNITSALDRVSNEEGFQKVIADLKEYQRAVKAGEVQNLKLDSERRAAVKLAEESITTVISRQTEWTEGIIKTRQEQATAYKDAQKQSEADIEFQNKQIENQEKLNAKLERQRKKAEAEAKKARNEAAEGSIEDLKKQIKALEDALDKTTDEKRQIEIILNIIELKKQLQVAEDNLTRLRAKYERAGAIDIVKLPTIGTYVDNVNRFLDEVSKKIKPKPINILEADNTVLYETVQRGLEGNIKFIQEELEKLKKDFKDNRLSGNTFFDFKATSAEIDKLQEKLSVLNLLPQDLLKLDQQQFDELEYDVIAKISEIRGKIAANEDASNLFGEFSLSSGTQGGIAGVAGAITQLGLLQAASSQTKDSLTKDLDILLQRLQEFKLTELGKGLNEATESFGYMSAAMGSLSESFKSGSKEAEIFSTVSKKLAAVQNILAQSFLIAGIARSALKGVIGIADMFALIAAFASALASVSSLFKFGEGGDLDSPDGHLLPKKGRGVIRGNKSHASGDDIVANYKGRNIRIESGEALVDVIGADGKPRKFVLSKRTMQDPVLRTILESVDYRIANARNSTYGNLQGSVLASGGELKANVGSYSTIIQSGGITPEQVQSMIDAQLTKLMIVNNVVDAEKVLVNAKKNKTVFEG